MLRQLQEQEAPCPQGFQGCPHLPGRCTMPWATGRTHHSRLLCLLPVAGCRAARDARQDSKLQTSLCTETLPPGWVQGAKDGDQLSVKGGALNASGLRPQWPQLPRMQVRDAQGAKQDLDNQGLAYKRRELQAAMTGQPRPSPFGALVFTCNGRGRHLYGEPHWDSRRLADFVPVPSSGFFCNGGCGCHATCWVGALLWLPLQ